MGFVDVLQLGARNEEPSQAHEIENRGQGKKEKNQGGHKEDDPEAVRSPRSTRGDAGTAPTEPVRCVKPSMPAP
jgi:hypothetical protein